MVPPRGTPAYRIFWWARLVCLVAIIGTLGYALLRWRYATAPKDLEHMRPRLKPESAYLYDAWARSASDFQVNDVILYEREDPDTKLRTRHLGLVRGLPGDHYEVGIKVETIEVQLENMPPVRLPRKVSKPRTVTVEPGCLYVGHSNPQILDREAVQIQREQIIGRVALIF